jgi:hypothetical protein
LKINKNLQKSVSIENHEKVRKTGKKHKKEAFTNPLKIHNRLQNSVKKNP